MNVPIDQQSLAALDDTVEEALRTGDETRLVVLGFGEISLVLGWPADAPRLAVKRLPVFADADRAGAYSDVFERYLKVLEQRGVDVVETDLVRLERADGKVVLYAVQQLLDPADLATAVLEGTDADGATRIFEGVRDATLAVCDATTGLDAQISNWAVVDGRIRYFDVTTPFLRDSAGRSLLDLDPFLAALPAVLRPAVRRLVLPDVIARYHRPRDVLLDLVGNLQRFGLRDLQPLALAAFNPSLDAAIGLEEARRYYRSDARLWAFMLRVRRLDRSWQRRVRRRPYPFLLPRESDR